MTLPNRLAQFRLDAYSQGKNLGPIDVVECDGCLLTPDMARRWLEMKAKAKADGVALKLSSGFRSMPESFKLWQEHLNGTRPTPVAKPGFSRHQSGVAMDVHVGDSPDSAAYKWLDSHAHLWGLTNVGATFSRPEWWHWELTHPEAGAATQGGSEESHA